MLYERTIIAPGGRQADHDQGANITQAENAGEFQEIAEDGVQGYQVWGIRYEVSGIRCLATEIESDDLNPL